ncbi:MAG TPA: hypothetical protein VIT65_17600 [Microlunatus sp.]
MSTEEPDRRWHAALAFALLGAPVRDLPETGTPRVAKLIADLGGVETVRTSVVVARASGSWPHTVPEELRRGLGAAQFAAVWARLLAELGPLTTNARPVVTDRASTSDERRLLADRPPHHGG